MDLTVKDLAAGSAAVIEHQEEKDGILYADIRMTSEKEEVPQPFSIFWTFPSKDCYSVWSPSWDVAENPRPNWHGKRVAPSRLAENMPVYSVLSVKGRNRVTVAVSDAVTPLSIAIGISEETACFECKVTFFTSLVSPLKEYRATIRIDMRDIPFYESIMDVTTWWEDSCGYTPAYIPEAARLPMNSLWYSYHQKLDEEDILRECALSKEYGMETVIIDDGWQTDDTNRGYSYCGDWEVAPGKISDMHEFVKKIHATGMKVVLWYSLPFIGENSKNYEKFKDMILDGTEKKGSHYALDPRYKEVRDFIVQLYRDAVLSWDLDGLKLDFISSFFLSGKSLEPDSRRDYESLEDAIDVLMTRIYDSLTELKKDILIEFRQTYVGPAIRKYGNMLRVGDCPNDAISNRKNVVKLRLTSGKTPVHSDMLMWSTQDTVESAALQFVSILYSVPQISVKIAKLNAEHKKMLKFYLNFWRENRDVLLHGKISAYNPESNYSLVRSCKDKKEIITAYTDNVIFGQDGICETIAVNSTRHGELILKNMQHRNYRVVNCMGEELEKGTLNSPIDIIQVPLAGMIIVN